ncbi:hypothetical protein DICPUDRAFT_75698 [Dictyostelium purpureum]|uniref:EGF-like domain-containing protein n=1 Tax=Dictyostelium purpureum TaxID=5786 RepID=F0ZBF0_DICPU|nr:uncharacterized protein DICPUDRAFT_75698 [Dictyostelium purpureum]EGC38761.1 hypothetical protein DICPUDRAFT_75698 [Dictyostelium purpureum]|eukprot:XP_003284752.1 hypothetical protein DICPUDRAFT_75698 [Dictyostelium purpureum]
MKLIIFLFFFSFFLIKCESTQLDCFYNFYSATGRTIPVIPQESDVCNIEGFLCNGSSEIIEINIDQLNGFNNIVNGNLIQCFNKLSQMTLNNFTLADDFLSNNDYYNQIMQIKIFYPKSYRLNNIASNIRDLTIKTLDIYQPGLESNQISLDIFSNVHNLNLLDVSAVGQQVVTFTPQTVLNTFPKSFNIFSKSLPSLHNFYASIISIRLQSQFTWSNFDTYYNVSDLIDISSKDLGTCIPLTDIQGKVEMKTKQLNIGLCIETNPNKIDMSLNYPNLEILQISSTKKFYNSEFQFSKVPETLSSFLLDSSSFGGLEYVFDVLRNVKSVELRKNTITNSFLPEYTLTPGMNLFLDLSNNNLSGSVPLSYCKAKLVNLSNNKLSGAIPDCFLCYMKNNFENYFENNQFSNYDQIGKCEDKIIPNLRVDSETKKIYLEGSNLGFDSNSITTTPPLVWFIQIPSELFIADYSQYMGTLDKLFNIKFNIPNQSFTLRTIRTKPLVNTVTAYSTGTVQFTGQDFTYDKSKIVITINQYDCVVKSSTYNSVICELVNMPKSLYATNMITYITVMDLYKNYTSQITVDFDYPNDKTSTIFQCPNDCNGRGICYSSLGQCICQPNTLNPNCQLNCNFGTYNATSDSCVCDSKHQGYFCKDPYFQCPSLTAAPCNGNGLCNNSTGVCTCFPGIEGDDCSKVLLKCPNDCTNPLQGTCDTSSGSCICKPYFSGNDCSIKNCINNCTNSGNCVNGICQCFPGKTLDDCSGIQCPNDCSNGNGTCNYSTGVCTCNPGRVGHDCSGIQCKVECQNGGTCDNTRGECRCKANWRGNECTIPVHYISSIEPCPVSGGQVTIYGWFGSIHQNLTISVGDLSCTDIIETETILICTLGGGEGTKSVNVTQNGSSFFGKNKFQYYNPVMKSQQQQPSNTTEPVKEIPQSTTAIDIDKGLATISNQDTNYEISIISLVEIDIYGKKVKNNLLQKKWNITTEQNIYQFSQTIDNEQYAEGQDICLVTYTIEEIKKTRQYEFAGLKLDINEGGLKVSVNISKYQFQNALNTLQLRFLSASSESTTPQPNQNNQCNQKESTIDVSNIDPNQTLNYISITKNNKQLSGRFINKVVSDTRNTFMSSEVVTELSNSSTIVVGLNLPHCTDECYIDPDFSVLVTSDFKSSCNGDKSKNWVIPVAVVVPCVFVIALIFASIVIYRKYRYPIRLFILSKKSNSSLKSTKLRNF